MPYIPPHLRPGYQQPVIKTIDYTGKVHWPTNLDSHRETNVIQPETMYTPRKSSSRSRSTYKKPIIKFSDPITLNTVPLARPSSRIKNYPTKFRTAVMRHLKDTNKKDSLRKNKSRKTRKALHHRASKKAKKTRRRI
jgi:hypothetical protein